MNPEILQYRSPRSLVDGSFPINGTLVTAQRRMAGALARRGMKAFDMKSVLKTLLPDWHDHKRQLRQRLFISYLLDEMAEKFSDEVVGAFRNNLSQVLKGLRTLAEIGVPAKSLPEDGEETVLLRLLYESFRKDPEGGVTLLEQRLSVWERPADFMQLLRKCRPCLDESVVGVPERVYFQGFYYVRPLQNRLMKAFELLDIPVVFLNAHDEDRPREYEVWTKNPLYADMIVRRIFGKPESTSKPELIRFQNLFAMVSWLRKNPDKLSLFSPMTADVRSILDSFFPKLEEKENLLAYPAGRYLWGLYSMWDPVANDLVLEPDTVRECLATGWAGPAYSLDCDALLGTYERVAHYFSDCRTPDEWIKRQVKLANGADAILRTAGQVKTEFPDDRWSRSLGNVSDRVGIVGEDPAKCFKLGVTLRQMIDDARTLFDGSSEVNLLEHFGRLRDMISRKASVRDLQQEEKNIVRHFQSRLAWTETDVKKVPSSHLPEAMGFFLGGKLVPEEDEEPSAYERIFGFSDIESSHLLRRNETVMLFCCDAQTLPSASHEYDWPMNAAYFDEIRLPIGADDVALRLACYRHYVESAVLSDRYLFHVASTLPKLKLSWVAERNGKELQPSPYLELIREEFDLEVKREDGLLVRSDPLDEVIRKPSEEEIREAVDTFLPGAPGQPLDVSASRQACPKDWRRVWYDYGVSNLPRFCSEYHLSFFFTALMAVRSGETGQSVETVAKKLFAAYPSFSASKRREITDFAKRQKNKVQIPMFKGQSRPLNRFFMQFLDINDTMRLIGSGKLSGSEKERLCNYCPHKGLCRGLIDKADV